jgi:ubiquinone/menaquinone biosynthesis C-methylase UbiE
MSFDRLAPHYRWMEFLFAGEKLHRCRTQFIPQLRFARRILILGEGNGRFLLECRRIIPEAKITCVDSSARMLRLAKQRVETNGLSTENIEFIHANALEWKPCERFDAIVTHFFLDCFGHDELGLLVDKLAGFAEPTSAWLIADFREPKSGIRRLRAQAILWSLYTFFRLATGITAKRIVPPDSLLAAHGFQLRQRRESNLGLLYSDWWQRSN